MQGRITARRPTGRGHGQLELWPPYRGSDTGHPYQRMNRRVLFLAEPAPLLCEGESLLSTFAARHPRDGTKDAYDNSSRVELDLLHLRRVLDDLSQFCRDQKQLTGITAREGGTGSGRGRTLLRGALGTTDVLSATPKTEGDDGSNKNSNHNNSSSKDDDYNSSNSGGSSSTRVLLAAVFPCPPPPSDHQNHGNVGITGTAAIKGVGQKQQQQQHEDRESQCQFALIACAFAETLDGCGVWLTPEDFQARVLVPTRALVDLQLGVLRSSSARSDGDALAVSAAAAAAATTAAAVRANPTQTIGNDDVTFGGAVGDRDRSSPLRRKRRRCASTSPSVTKSPKMSPASTMSPHLGRCVGMEAGGGVGAQASTSSPPLDVPLSEEDQQRGTDKTLALSGDINNTGNVLSSSLGNDVVAAPTLPLTTPSTGNPETTSAISVNGGVDYRAVDEGHGANAATSAVEEDFARGAAEEIEGLLRAAAGDGEMAGCPRSVAGVGSARGAQLEGDRGPQRVLFDVVWAAASMPVGAVRGPYYNRAQEPPVHTQGEPTPTRLAVRGTGEAHEAAESSQPHGVITPNKYSRLTLSAQAGVSRSAPVREALRAVCEMFPQSCVTIWPSAGGGDPADFPVSALTPAKRLGDVVPLGGVSTEGTGTVGSRRSERQSESEAAASRQWELWCSYVSGARVFFGQGPGGGPDGHKEGHDGGRTGDGEEQIIRDVVLEPGLLWRGSIVAAATIAPPTEAPPITASRNPDPDQAFVFPALEGFAIRVARPRPMGDSALDGSLKEEDDDQRRAVPGSMSAVSRAAASVLARAPSLRLSRLISPAAVARVCHLLADGAVAPALELYAHDAGRFPGSAAFLQGWAADGRGMLLVAAVPAAEDGCGERDGAAASAARGEEGLVMACFRIKGRHRERQRGGSGRGSDAAAAAAAAAPVWSVTLFRRPSEFSGEAVAALVAGRSVSPEVTPQCAMVLTTVRNSLKDGETADDLSEGVRDGSPAARGVRRSSRISSCQTSDASLENNAISETSVNDKGGEETPAAGSVPAAPTVVASVAEVIGGLPVFTWQSLLAETSVAVAGPVSSSVNNEEEVPLAGNDGTGKKALGKAVPLKKDVGAPAAPVKGEVGAGPPVDGCSAGRGVNGSTTIAASTRVTKPNKLLVSAEVGDATANQTDVGVDLTASSASFTPAGALLAEPTIAAAYALYASFGNWTDDGPGGASRFSWAEESLLPKPGSPQLLSTGSSGSRTGSATGGVVPPSTTSDGCAGPRTAGSSGKNETMLEERGNGHKTVMSSSSSSSSSSGAGVTTATVAVPPRRALSTAEEALEKAGHQQRARVKERRMIAREQRARMDRPRPRVWQGGSSGSARAAAAVSAGSSAGASGGGVIRRPSGGASGGAGRGGGAFRRGNSSAVPSSGSGTGWSAAGSKLSRGSLILERSVGGVGTATAGGANAVGAGSGASVARAERGESCGGGDGTPSAIGGPRVVQPPVGAGVLSWRVGASASGAEATVFGRKDQRPPAVLVPSRSSLNVADAGRVRRAIFQDQPPPPPPPPPASVAPASAEGVTAKRPSPLPVPLESLRPTTAAEGARRREKVAGDTTCFAKNSSPVQAPAVGVTRAAAVTTEVEQASATVDGTGVGGSLGVSREEAGQQHAMSVVMGGLLAGGDGGAGDGAVGSDGGGDRMMREVIERAMRSAVALQMGLPEGDSRVGDVFEREIRHMRGGVGGGS